MVFNQAPKAPVGFSAGAPAFRPGVVILAVIFVLLLAGGILTGLKFQSINAEQEAQLREAQSAETAQKAQQDSEIIGLRDADQKLAEARDKNRDIEQRLTNQDGFLK